LLHEKIVPQSGVNSDDFGASARDICAVLDVSGQLAASSRNVVAACFANGGDDACV
jgi:hypothetical protein